MFHMTQTKQGISALELLERNREKPLEGRIEMDDAYLGGERSGGKRGRGSPGKTPFLAAVETTEDGKAHRTSRSAS
jgi:hypothetical protein